MQRHLELTDALRAAVKASLLATAKPMQDRLEQLDDSEPDEVDYDALLARVVDGDDSAIDEIVAQENASADRARAWQIRAEAATIIRERIHTLLASEDQTTYTVGQLAAAIARLSDQAAGLRRAGRDLGPIATTAEASLARMRELFDVIAPAHSVAAECRQLYDHCEETWLEASGQRRAAA